MNNEPQNENTQQSKKPSHTVYSVKEVNGKDYWNTHGIAFEHASGQGLNVILNFFGMDINFVILKNTDKK